MSEYRLVMKGVVKTFPGVKALDHAQLELRPGKVMALMGENGAGKSTLMKCMFGIYKMDEGEIEYEGQKVTIPTPLDALDRGIAMVHQELQPIPARTVAENIWLGRYPTKKYGPVTVVDHAKMYKDTEELLKKLKSAGVRLAVCSNKADEFSQVIVAHYFPGIFEVIRGNLPGTPVKPDPGVARGILEKLNARPEETLMVGDSDVDIRTGHNAGLKACGVTWGFRSRENLVNAGADFLADTPAELEKLLMN